MNLPGGRIKLQDDNGRNLRTIKDLFSGGVKVKRTPERLIHRPGLTLTGYTIQDTVHKMYDRSVDTTRSLTSEVLL